MRLDGMAAIVTGGASGLGAATVRRLIDAGCRVAALDINPGTNGIACDVADASSAEAAVAKAREMHGPARILVNCAGVGTAGRIVGRDGPMQLAAFERVIRINLIGSFNLLRLAAADMIAFDPLDDGERGVIINTASIAAFEGQIGQPAYAASKAGVVGMTLPAARELARFGVRVVTIAPGLFHTPMVEALPEETQRGLGDAVPFPQRLGLPEEYAALVEHIATNRFLNGETIRLDGALRMQPR
jgi:NAD(P)-dependent dehydrogenase (short-subunit alcohol dehydrogenase family)